ncbi:M12 family metallo-peptidase [Rhodopirellula sallentina]|uniref:M12 family metallo-peptidase n=1 Tax=Rhodopirellula sallentina TaxID=1263869 RepID=UPI001F1A0511|nr:M12 family metallo-peptidase [Rhodopirellula sallentina]
MIQSIHQVVFASRSSWLLFAGMLLGFAASPLSAVHAEDAIRLVSNKGGTQSKATLPPTRVMDVLEYEIGVEIGSRAFFEKSAYNGDLEAAKKVVETIVPNLERRYLHAAGIQFRLGKVIIRTDKDNDPLRDFVRETGGGGKAGSSLAAFRDYWNKHPQLVGTTHDLACYHVYYPPSGLAYVKSVGSRQRYATVGGRGKTSWANGTLAHEFGHSWGLHHTNKSGFFYESSPRVKEGAHTAGGKPNPISIMVGNRGNIGRMASDEAMKVLATRNERRSHGDPVTPRPVKPFGMRDEVNMDKNSIVIDVIANDYDVNNDVLDASLLDTVSYHGGIVSLSKATSPGGRNEIKYVMPKGGLPNGEDFFHYTVFDTTGKTDFGAVYIRSNKLMVDLSAGKYNYDFGTETSPVEPGYTRVSPSTIGDVVWRGDVKSADRGSASGINKINQDFVYSEKPKTLRHRIANGVYRVTMNMGDRQYSHDRMGVRAEGRLITDRLNADKGQYAYVGHEGDGKPTNFEVKVTDGRLDLTFFDKGGADPNWVLNRLSIERVNGL